MIDSHTHLDRGPVPAAELVAEAVAAGVRRMLTVGMDSESCRAALAGAAAHPEVFAALGRHPNVAEGFDAEALAELTQLAAHPDCRAIGETGLDFYRESAPAADQRRAFLAQLELARTLDKPVVIHSRAAEEETIATLREHAGGLRVILHCFSMPDALDACLAQPAWTFSFAGNVTYPSSQALAETVAQIPLDRLLVETDAPYLSPQPHRRERNRPAYVVETARFVADRRGVAYAVLEAAVEANAARLFRW